jgi:hypothetical protein
MVTTIPSHADVLNDLKRNLKLSCANHFRKDPGSSSPESARFCSCFAEEFISTLSLPELEAANGIMTPEIQSDFDRAGSICAMDVSPEVARSARDWIEDTD